jgi:hypothetical protein
MSEEGKRVFTPLGPLYKVENAFARLGMWRRLSRCYEQTALGAQTWLGVACVAYPCGRLPVEADLTVWRPPGASRGCDLAASPR